MSPSLPPHFANLPLITRGSGLIRAANVIGSPRFDLLGEIRLRRRLFGRLPEGGHTLLTPAVSTATGTWARPGGAGQGCGYRRVVRARRPQPLLCQSRRVQCSVCPCVVFCVLLGSVAPRLLCSACSRCCRLVRCVSLCYGDVLLVVQVLSCLCYSKVFREVFYTEVLAY